MTAGEKRHAARQRLNWHARKWDEFDALNATVRMLMETGDIL